MSAAPPPRPSLPPSRPPRTTWPGRRSAAAHAPCPLPCPAESGALEQNGGGRSGAGRERAVLSGEDGGGERLREVRRRGQPRGDRRLGGGPGSVSRRQRGGGEIADAPAAGLPELGPAVPSAGCGQAPPAPASPLPDRSSAAVAGLVCGAPRPTGPPAAGSGPSGAAPGGGWAQPEGIPVRICGSGLASASSRPPQCPLLAARAGVARRRRADPRRGVSESPHSGAVRGRCESARARSVRGSRRCARRSAVPRQRRWPGPPCDAGFRPAPHRMGVTVVFWRNSECSVGDSCASGIFGLPGDRALLFGLCFYLLSLAIPFDALG